MQQAICQTAANPSLFSAESFVGLVFLVTIGLIISGAVMATVSKRLVRCITGLAVCFTGVAGAYYFLLSPFVAMMQMLIYVGAVSILIAFGIMMATPESEDTTSSKGAGIAGPLGIAVGSLIFSAFTLLAVKTDWQVFPRAAKATGDMEAMGKNLLTSHSLVFELVSIVLLIAIIGALVLARRGRN
jgi:NADH-quinone oxidoreductase subunit J